MELAKLQNGSDIRGVASEGIAGQPVNLTDEAVFHLAAGFICWQMCIRDRDRRRNAGLVSLPCQKNC